MADTSKADLSKLRIDRSVDPAEPETSSSWTKWVLLAILAGAVITAVLFYSSRPAESMAVEVQTFTISPAAQASQNAVLTASGYVVAQRKAAVASKGTGRMVYLGVEEGDKVTANQVLARLESDDMEAALALEQSNLELAKARLKQAEAERDEAKLNNDRYRELLQDELVSQSQFDEAELRYKRAVADIAAWQSSIAAAEASIRTAEIALDNTNIRAPFDGTVLTKNADVGEIVAPFGSSNNARAAVVTIADMSSLEVEADVSESNIQRVSVEQPCEIVLDAYPDRRYPGNVSKIVPTADRAKATVLTKIKFRERDARVLPEMSAKVYFLAADSARITTGNQTIMIPTAATMQRGGQTAVYIVRNNAVQETRLQIGSTNGAMVEVLAGLKYGDVVVLNPSTELKSGVAVKTVR